MLKLFWCLFWSSQAIRDLSTHTSQSRVFVCCVYVSVHSSVHVDLSSEVDRGNVPCNCPLISLSKDIHVQSEPVTQLKEAVKQSGLSMPAPGVSVLVNKAPCSPRLAMMGDSTEQTSTPAAPGNQKGMNTH